MGFEKFLLIRPLSVLLLGKWVNSRLNAVNKVHSYHTNCLAYLGERFCNLVLEAKYELHTSAFYGHYKTSLWTRMASCGGDQIFHDMRWYSIDIIIYPFLVHCTLWIVGCVYHRIWQKFPPFVREIFIVNAKAVVSSIESEPFFCSRICLVSL